MSPDVAASVRARLLNRARAGGEEFELTLTRFAAERLLFRLGASAARERCILKGACLLSVWLPNPYRATRDVDVLASGPTDDGAIRSLVSEICRSRNRAPDPDPAVPWTRPGSGPPEGRCAPRHG